MQIAGVPTRNVGRNSGKLRESAVWNVRLTLSHAMQGKELRDTRWSPSKALPPLFTPSQNLSETYGPWKWAKDAGRTPGRFRAGDFPDAAKMEPYVALQEQVSG